MKLRTKQYGGDGKYFLMDNGEADGKRINFLWMTAKDAQERNDERKLHHIVSRWWWAGKKK
jgi:hypothetical protein